VLEQARRANPNFDNLSDWERQNILRGVNKRMTRADAGQAGMAAAAAVGPDAARRRAIMVRDQRKWENQNPDVAQVSGLSAANDAAIADYDRGMQRRAMRPGFDVVGARPRSL
jgi:hypothetical protein